MTESKRETLYALMGEYSRVVNIFIDMFWEQSLERKDLTKEITNQPDSWLSARARQCTAREALGMVTGAQSNGHEKPVHYGKKMTLSAQCVKIEDGANAFDIWLVISSVGNLIKLYIPLKSHRHMNGFDNWTRSSTVTIHRDYVQFTYEIETGPKLTVGHMVGLDVGINHLFATSDGTLHGRKTKALINVIKRRKYGSKGWWRAKKTLRYYLHRMVKEYFQANTLRLVVVEKLHKLRDGKKGRSKGFRKTLHYWDYRVLLDIIRSHCERNRVSKRSVNPYKTSQTCPVCDHVARDNRQNAKFCCLNCGHSNHADTVGAQNILSRLLCGQYGAAFKT